LPRLLVRIYRAANEPKRIALFPEGAPDDYSTMAQGRRRGLLWIRWAVAPDKKRKVTDGARTLV
jgi:hypothetical protein